jgi:hypothetical protein
LSSQAIRAVRHPERYGPRAGNPNTGGPASQGQTRTGGLGRAIIDTFPLIKFGRTSDETTVAAAGQVKGVNDLEGAAVANTGNANATRMEMTPLSRTASAHGREPQNGGGNLAPSSDHVVEEGIMGAAGAAALVTATTHEHHDEHEHSPATTSNTDSQPSSGPDGVVPAAIGRETCPICIVDFEVGDDLRVLPCPGKHRFHQECVDPWLLELSSSCPICRQGLFLFPYIYRFRC